MSNLPSILYHYQPIHTDEYKDRLQTLLTERVLYCSSPAEFNDPWDCKAYFCPEDFYSFTQTPDGVRWLTEKLVTYTKIDNPVEAAEAMRLICQDPNYRARLLEGIQQQVRKDAEQHWRIFCLSPSPNINLMWSRYAYGHMGICLGFSTSNPPFTRACPVSYSTPYPKIRLRDLKDNPFSIPQKMLLSKSDDWDYEQEWRLLARPKEFVPPQLQNHALMTQNNYLPFPAEALQVVVVGCRGDYVRVKSLVQECASKVAVKKAVTQSDQYQLTIQND